ncbi:MAG: hypothetical protein J0M12_08605 [Deltaproteobacteria bacterium]|nr:hypothetical protein [Deltaproteobacteria bacterium]
MAEKTAKNSMSRKHGRFLLSRDTFRVNVLIYFLTWTSLALILCAVFLQPESISGLWWVVLVTFFNTLAVGLSHREMLRLTIAQEIEIIADSRVRESEVKTSKTESKGESSASLFDEESCAASSERLARQ